MALGFIQVQRLNNYGSTLRLPIMLEIVLMLITDAGIMCACLAIVKDKLCTPYKNLSCLYRDDCAYIFNENTIMVVGFIL